MKKIYLFILIILISNVFSFTQNLSIAKLTVIKAEDFHEKSEKTNIAYTTEMNVQRPLLKTINFTNNRKNRKFSEMVDRTNLNFHPKEFSISSISSQGPKAILRLPITEMKGMFNRVIRKKSNILYYNFGCKYDLQVMTLLF